MSDMALVVEGERAAANSYQMFLSVEPDGDVIRHVLDQLGTWLRGKGLDVALDAIGFRQDGDRDLTTLHRQSSDSREFRARLVERTQSTGTWRTQLTVQVPARGNPWIALQVANSEGRETKVPRLATYLLDTLAAKDGATPLSSGARLVTPNQVQELADQICDPDRQGLLYVAGSGRTGDLPFEPYRARVERWTRDVRGLAQVVVLAPEATEALRDAIGPDHAVRPWTLRTFAPGVDPAIPADALRHRFLSPQRLGEDPDGAIASMLGRTARRHAALRTLPVAYIQADRALRRLEDRLLIERVTVLLPQPAPTRPPTPESMTAATAPPPAAEPGALYTTTALLLPQPTPVPDGDLTADKSRVADESLAAEEPPALVAEGFEATTAQAAALDGALEPDAAPELGSTPKPDAVPEWAVSEIAALLDTLEMVRSALGVCEVTPEAMGQIATQLSNARAASRAVTELKAQLEERELLLAEAQDSVADYKSRSVDLELGERIALEEASKQAGEIRWLRKRLAEVNDAEAAYGSVPEDAVTALPDDFNELCRRLPDLADTGVIFTGDDRITRRLDEVDTLGTIAITTWRILLVLADYVQARNTGDFTGGIRQYLEKPPQGYRTVSVSRFAPVESEATMKQWGGQRVFPVPTDVNPEGRAEMQAHFKLASLGMVSPRMHLLDCWTGHKQVFIGYVGPHLRTTLTN